MDEKGGEREGGVNRGEEEVSASGTREKEEEHRERARVAAGVRDHPRRGWRDVKLRLQIRLGVEGMREKEGNVETGPASGHGSIEEERRGVVLLCEISVGVERSKKRGG